MITRRTFVATSPAALSAPAYLFAEEFDGPNGSPPDSSKWNVNTGYGEWGNDELETYTKSPTNLFQDGQSHLVIRTLKKIGGYTSARINTAGKFEASHATFEARIKLSRQAGLWPAFWMMGDDPKGWPWQGEIDIMESYGDLSWGPDSSVHTANADGSASTASHAIPGGIDNGWHVYAVQHQLSNGNLVFLKDGVPYHTVIPGSLPHWPFCTPGKAGVPLFMILNQAVGGTGGNGTPPPSTRFPVDMLIDWVHVF